MCQISLNFLTLKDSLYFTLNLLKKEFATWCTEIHTYLSFELGTKVGYSKDQNKNLCNR
jgi:hypothetical protein